MLLRQMFPDVDWNLLGEQIKEAQTTVPKFAEALKQKVEEMDARLANIERLLAEGRGTGETRIGAEAVRPLSIGADLKGVTNGNG